MQHFVDVQFMTGNEKQLVLKQWKTFIKNGMKSRHFTNRIYDHLSLHCSFIAHYNRAGFYSMYFEVPEKTQSFLGQFNRKEGALSIEYGGRSWLAARDYNDLNEALCEVVEQYVEIYNKQLEDAAKNRDLAQAKALLERHGLKMLIKI